ncbi:hypothetical protein PC118_g11723 [Phytophthora cactorum]|uniref:Uncharacterized protein n=1 Tax=Phytophthora cactorum TaxID=29920 RepID=A0A8T1FNN9_9STRA|nr:hypothetical protein PC118_g11723 [Phytophthora cactorum]
MMVDGDRRSVKLDSCARYIVAGTDWMKYGDEPTKEAPVDYVEGIGGFLLNVVGISRFQLTSVFDKVVAVDGCIVDGCTGDFLLGVDLMQKHGATMDFERNEIRYKEDSRAVVIPFRTSGVTNNARMAAVRMVC